LVSGLALLLLPSAAFAQTGAPDYGRRGFYVGVNGIGSVEFFGSQIEDLVQQAFPGSTVNVGDAAGLNARVGYRIFSWLAAEGMYEWVQDFETFVSVPGSGSGTTSSVFHNLYFNLKLLLPVWRLHPYLVGGVGAQYGDVQGTIPVLGPVSETRWDFAGRPGAGVDFYLTENLVLNAEVAGVLSVADFDAAGTTLTDIFYLTVGGGFQWRF
ncbi:MAG: outer membrane beta-barrel protein, partial [Thermoanaerobaculia bacterium]|nr:outer membrane beta-barrel protein [Thermoanaerobaculia bacterium]